HRPGRLSRPSTNIPKSAASSSIRLRNMPMGSSTNSRRPSRSSTAWTTFSPSSTNATKARRKAAGSPLIEAYIMTRPIVVAVSARLAAIRLPVPKAFYHLPRPLAWRLAPVARLDAARQGLADRVVTLVHGLSPATDYVFEAEGFEPVLLRTAECAGLVD